MDALPALSRYLSTPAKANLPTIGRSLGLTGRNEGGTVIIGRPGGQLTGPEQNLHVYEPHRNLTIHPNGSFSIATPTPSGQRLMHQEFKVKGAYAEPPSRVEYRFDQQQPYPAIPDPRDRGPAMLSQVITRGDSRQFGVGMMNWTAGRQNFMPAKDVIDAVKASRPVDVSTERINQVVGNWVSNPQASGFLLGFDKKAGEAIVGYGNRPAVGFEHWHPSNAVVKSLDGFYPVDLLGDKGTNVTAYRNAVGQLFEAQEIPGGFKLHPASETFAFKPSEVFVRDLTLDKALGLDSRTGLRALGGYHTQTGGRIPIRMFGN